MNYKIHPQTISCAAEASALLWPALLRRSQECFLVLCLTAAHQPIGKPALVSMGTANRTEVHPRDVFREAIRRNAVAVIVGHNHPSGSADPSLDDKELTTRLVRAGELLGIPVLDHIILGGDGGHASMSERGEI